VAAHLQARSCLEPKALSKQFINFEDAKKVDLQNERLPPSHDDVERKSFEGRRQALERAAWRLITIQLYKVLQEGSACELSAILHKMKCC
jgi:hypothetical protein